MHKKEEVKERERKAKREKKRETRSKMGYRVIERASERCWRWRRKEAGHGSTEKTEKEAKVLLVKRMCVWSTWQKKKENYIKKLDCSRCDSIGCSYATWWFFSKNGSSTSFFFLLFSVHSYIYFLQILLSFSD